jgi:hypothetical protein
MQNGRKVVQGNNKVNLHDPARYPFLTRQARQAVAVQHVAVALVSIILRSDLKTKDI